MNAIFNKLGLVWSWIMADRKHLVGMIVVVIVLIFGIWKFVTNQGAKVQYQTSTVQKGTVVSTVSASGKALTTSVLSINSQASGIVNKVYVKDGDKVYAGQKIAGITLDSSGQQSYSQSLASFLTAKNNLASANSNVYTLQSAEFTANQKFINDAVARNLATTDPTYIEEYADWKAAEAKYLQQETAISQAQASLNNSSISLSQNSPTITSPFSGVIANIGLVEGMVLTSSSSNKSS